ncbi:prion-inhibition and propagation-domain-containing protein [Podospora appendiculata]|uniref:Prion-inhibition and propagation-domain-containing protein n=1 Tax=Podospora appendiculata TaxID=314037 RepID=A0AAE0WYV0_9PEZI|nr:prion-inhibition and propagation-domain-containing protein [Podospora appendiculata]
MAEAAGLAIGILGILALFTSCIENFDIIVKAREFGDEFDLLCTQLSLQRVRLVLWAPEIKPAIESTLHHLRSLLQKADLVTGRYELQAGRRHVVEADRDGIQPSSSAGLAIFRDRFESFKARIRHNQKSKSKWIVTRWAVHDLPRFRAIIGSIRDLIDGLEGITSALGVLERQQALLALEVGSISDSQSLHLLQDLALDHDSSYPALRIASETASIRLSIVAVSVKSEARKSRGTGSSQSYRTAQSHRPGSLSRPSLIEELSEGSPSILSEVSAPGSPRVDTEACYEAAQDLLRLQAASGLEEHDSGSQATTIIDQPLAQTPPTPRLEDIPQNQRLMAELLSRCPPPTPELSFSSGSSCYGNVLTDIKINDEEIWGRQSARLLVNADNGMATARTIFLELRSIRNAGVPFISAIPLGDSLDKVVASIEGPPDTPYEGGGGVFWILVLFSLTNAHAPPALRFLTKIYHPNIDCNGNI